MNIPKHKNTGNNNRQKPLAATLASARKKLKWAEENLACPFATKIVRDMAGVVTLRNDAAEGDVKHIFLPPNTTMRGLWLDWVRERGWDPIKTCKNRQIFKKKDEWEMSKGFYETLDEADAAQPYTLPDGTIVPPNVAKPVVTFECFRKLWKREFPHLRVRARGEDTCTNCFLIKNRMRFLLNKKQKIQK